MDSPQAKQLLSYIETLPFAKVKKEKTAPKSKWETAIAEGAVSVDSFFDELNSRIDKWPDNA